MLSFGCGTIQASLLCLMLKSFFNKIIILTFIVWTRRSHKLNLFFDNFLIFTRMLFRLIYMQRGECFRGEVNMRWLTLFLNWFLLFSTWFLHDWIASTIYWFFLGRRWKLIYLNPLVIYILGFTKRTHSFTFFRWSWKTFHTDFWTFL